MYSCDKLKSLAHQTGFELGFCQLGNMGRRKSCSLLVLFRKKKNRKERTTLFGVNLIRSQVLYRAAQARCVYWQRQKSGGRSARPLTPTVVAKARLLASHFALVVKSRG